ncbi:receptor like protein 6 [Prunus dulcis]|uniref:Receptor like protein 6 n=1 Tax=Prunus dulcis TaxID=3755 RepID=A0A4Y1R6Q1_PRUDU|nr:receptor like protein 6 [Prunus dulcis]
MGMESWWSKFISVRSFILLLLNATHCFSPVQSQALGQVDECSALLQFKESFAINKSVSADPLAYPKVSFWKREGDGNRSNCCSWDGVECDEDSGHVVGLNLSSSCLYGSIYSSNTLFRLVHLQRLDLSDNHFNFSQIPSRFGHDLSSLTYLNLSNSLFSGQIPSEISKLSKLSTLDLSFNYQKADDGIPLKLTKANMRSLVQNLTTIKQLHLNWVEMYFTVPDILVNASSLTSLQLGDCELNGEFPVGIFHLPNLEVLDVNGNSNLTGYFPNFNKSNVFKKLNVGATNFSGMLPASMGNLHSLNFLDISWCHFYPLIPSSLGNLTQLNYLVMNSFNDVSKGKIGEFPSFVSNLTQLEFLDLSDNEISGQIPSWLMKLTQLTSLSLDDNNLQGPIPRSLFQLKNLEYLSLSGNNLSGLVEFDQFSKLKKLKGLDLSNNMLSVGITNDLSATLPKLQTLALGFCKLQGPLPIPPQSIRFYDVENNEYTGEISPLFCNFNYLQVLELSNNHLSGMIPKCLGNSSVLKILGLHNNFFNGYIPPICPSKTSLRIVDFSYNQLQGKLPRGVMNCTQLKVLNFANNQMSDIFPSWLGALPELRILILRSNGFHGVIGKPATKHEFPKLHIIDLSNNGFSGMLPSNYLEIWNSMKYVDENRATYYEVDTDVLGGHYYRSDYAMTIRGKGVELKYERIPYHLTLIDLSSNRFEGEIPEGPIGNLRGLVLLNLSNNYLTGHIPSSLGDLAALESLDLSQNQLSGRIPSNLAQLTFLEYFNVSHNHLSGPIPLGEQFDTFQEDSYEGNSGLCGKYLPKKCEDSGSSTRPPPSIVEEDEDSVFQTALGCARSC